MVQNLKLQPPGTAAKRPEHVDRLAPVDFELIRRRNRLECLEIMPDLEAFARGIPKAELHVHIEGALEPEMMFHLAQRNQHAIPFGSPAQVRAAYEFENLQSFLDIYYQSAAVLQTEQDFYDLMWAYLERARADSVLRAEIFFDPQTHTGRGVPFEEVVRGLYRATADAREALGISAELIMCFLRHLSAEEASATLDQAMAFREMILGVGLDSSEVDHPPEPFEDVFERARRSGLRTVAHAGEEGPAAYIWGALDVLGAERIDHGVRCVDDESLIARLADDGTPLTMCPLSNLRLRVFGDLEEHSLKTLHEQGLKVTINSDDPAYFGGYVAENYVALVEALGLTVDDVAGLARASFEASFSSPEDKAAFLGEVDRFVASWTD